MYKFISISLLVLSVLAIYIIIYVGLERWWPLGYSNDAEKVNVVAINLAYSYIVGYIVYLLTVSLPQLYTNIKLRPVIKNKIKSIQIKLSNILTGFPSNENPLIIDIYNIDQCKKIMEEADWNITNNLPIYPKNNKALYQTFFIDYKEIISLVDEIIAYYKVQLSTKQLLLLEKLRSVSFMSPLEVLVKAQVKIPPNGQQFIVDEFIQLLHDFVKLENSF